MEENLKNLEDYFTACGYPLELTHPILEDVRKTPRCLEYKSKDNDRPFLVPFIQPYGIGSSELKHYVDNSVNKSLNKAPVFNNVNNAIIKSVYSKGPSLHNLLFRQKDISLGRGSGMSIRCISIEESLHKRGAKCKTCPLMAESDTVELNGNHYNNLEGGTCKSRLIIYLAKCTICPSMAYVGKTDTPLHIRVNGHRNATSKDGKITDEQALAHHASSHKVPFNDIYKVYVIKHVGRPDHLLMWVSKFINKFNTKHPFGLNLDNPMGLRVLIIK